MTEIQALWGALAIIAGACTGGYFHLSSRLNYLSDHIDTSRRFTAMVEKLGTDVHEIKIALIGDYSKPGLIRKVHDVEKEVNVIKEAIKP